MANYNRQQSGTTGGARRNYDRYITLAKEAVSRGDPIGIFLSAYGALFQGAARKGLSGS
jgi:hypothetical protein